MSVRPVPTKLRVLRGNPSKRPLPENEPEPRVGNPTCPDHLDDEAKAQWARIVPELLRLGLLTMIDTAALAAYCQNYSRWVKAELDLQKRGLFLVNKANKIEYQNPSLKLAHLAMRDMRSFLIEFGLTPASRSKVAGSGKPHAGNPKSKFFRAS